MKENLGDRNRKIFWKKMREREYKTKHSKEEILESPFLEKEDISYGLNNNLQNKDIV